LIREKLQRNEDTGSYSPHKLLRIVVEAGR
jgi:hypothetical protein